MGSWHGLLSRQISVSRVPPSSKTEMQGRRLLAVTSDTGRVHQDNRLTALFQVSGPGSTPVEQPRSWRKY